METISTKTFKGAFILGANRLTARKEEINELNVFPVPDGDTGTNMSMTMDSALSQVMATDDEVEPKVLCKAVSQGALMGARGNSGVILSQLFRGFYKVIKTADTIDTLCLAEAFNKATETAYRAVMNPKEGTILTVAKAISDKATEICTTVDDIGQFYDEILDYGKEILQKTPDMLPVLKQAGVVDSGGTGLIAIMEGACDFINGREERPAYETPADEHIIDDETYMYELDARVRLDKKAEGKTASDLRVYLEAIGDLTIFDAVGSVIEYKLFSDEPGKAITKSTKFGVMEAVRLINTREEYEGELFSTSNEPPKEVGFVAVSIGDGIDSLFKELGVDATIKGGQTMNPSTDDIVSAVKKVNAENVFILPNNKNIILAAQQAAQIVTDKKVHVMPTSTLPQGISAMLSYIPESDIDSIREGMEEMISNVKSGEVTHAVRDTEIDDKTIKEGDFMGIGEGKILSVEKTVEKAVLKLVEELIDDESSIITLYYGEDMKEKDANKLSNKITKKYPHIDVELQMGGQPVYYYVLSVE